jgi:hypothetical protein
VRLAKRWKRRCIVVARPIIENCLPHSRQTMWAGFTDCLTGTAGSGLGGSAVLSSTAASVLKTCWISEGS